LPQKNENFPGSFTRVLPEIYPLLNFAILRNFSWNISVSIAARLSANISTIISGFFAANIVGTFTVNLEILQICRNCWCRYCHEFAASFVVSLQQVLPRVCS
jgi:hypothetical protein